MTSHAILAQQALNDFFFRRDSADDIFAKHSDSLFLMIFWISTLFFVVLMVLMVVFVLKYKRKPGRIAPPSASHNTIMELAWTIIPLAILAIFFFRGFWGYIGRVVAPGESVELLLQAQKWIWSVTYPNGESTPETVQFGASENAPVFYVPAGVPVRMKMSSIDVVHSFWVPDFRGKFDVFPNRYTSYWFEANAPGPTAKTLTHKDGSTYPYEDHWIFCAEYCGDKHSEMTAIMRVVPKFDYHKVVYEEWGGSKPPVVVGQNIWKTRCASCHSVDGSKNIGPTWKNIYGHAVEFADGSKHSEAEMTGDAFDNYVRESIIAPSAKVVAGFPNQMTSFAGQLSEIQINGVIAYIRSISDKAPKVEEGGEAPAGGEAKPGEKPAEAKPAGAGAAKPDQPPAATDSKSGEHKPETPK